MPATSPSPEQASAARGAPRHSGRRGARPAVSGLAPATVAIVGILLVAAAMRAPITAVGPLLETIRADLGLSATGAGALSMLPLLAFAAVSPLAPALARRLGLERALGGALVLLVVGTLLRSGPGVAALFGGTVLIGVGIGLVNVLLSALVKRDYSHRVAALTGVYTTVMSGFAMIASGLAVPIATVAPGGWRTSLAVWVGFAAVAAAVWLRPGGPDASPAARTGAGGEAAGAGPGGRDTAGTGPVGAGVAGTGSAETAAVNPGPVGAGPAGTGPSGPGPAGPAPAVALSGRPARSVWRSGLAWQLTFFFGLQSMGFYVAVNWLAAILHSRGTSMAAAGWYVALMQLTGLVASAVTPVLVRRLPDQRLLAAGAALLGVVSYPALVVASGLALVWSATLGLGQGVSITLALSLFALRARDAAQAAALSGMGQSLGYVLAGLGPLVFGALHDLTGDWTVPLLLVTAAIGVQGVLAFGAGRVRYVR
ncbi:MAG: MFS transporter [Micromonosporaceae bacterium]